MAVNPDMHVGDYGTAFEMIIKNRKTNKPLPLTDVVASLFLFRPPTDPVFVAVAEIASPPDGLDGKLFYVWLDGDVEEEGEWEVQGLVEDADGEWHTDIELFEVGANIDIVVGS